MEIPKIEVSRDSRLFFTKYLAAKLHGVTSRTTVISMIPDREPQISKHENRFYGHDCVYEDSKRVAGYRTLLCGGGGGGGGGTVCKNITWPS